MKISLRYVLALSAMVCGIAANAQTTILEFGEPVRVSGSQWKYSTVTCSSTNSITSIFLSMINNKIVTFGGVAPSRTVNSLGNNPRTVLYLFTPAITAAQATTFLEGMTFDQVADHAGVSPYVNISVDANPTMLPSGATITVWDGHPDGSPHYYVWVPYVGVDWEVAYNGAKSYYFQGMRGYLPTMTTAEESQLLTNISSQEGWSAGARTPDNIADQTTTTRPTRNNTTGANYRWVCGPETGFFYHYGPTYSSGHAMNGAFDGWNTTEPNDSGGEWVMEVNHSNLKWNDYAPTTDNVKGYFIEFGGNGTSYTVGTATYPANPQYYTPTVTTTNDQWYQFSPGNKASTSTAFKPNVMRANVLVLE